MNKLTQDQMQAVTDRIELSTKHLKGQALRKEQYSQLIGASHAIVALGYEIPPYWLMNAMSGTLARIFNN